MWVGGGEGGREGGGGGGRKGGGRAGGGRKEGREGGGSSCQPHVPCHTHRYDSLLERARKLGGRKGASVGISLGIVYFLIFFFYSLSFWFGAYLVSQEQAQPGDIITVGVGGGGRAVSYSLLPACLPETSFPPGQVFFAILVGAFYLGQGGTNYQLLLEASQAVSNMSAIIKRVCVCAHGTCVCVQQYSYLVATATGY